MASAGIGQLLHIFGKCAQSSYVTQVRIITGMQIKCWNSTSTASEASSSVSTGVAASDITNQKESGNQFIKFSKAMKAYQERAQAHDKFMFEQIGEYEIGRRHLANMMGEDPETFTEEDIAKSIEYLLPSGLYEPLARPVMKHPSEIFAKKKAAEFDDSGRPFHTLFYTGIPSYYQVLHDLTGKVRELDRFSDRMIRYNVHQDQERTLDIGATDWVTKDQLENILLEKLKDSHYEFFIKSMNRLVDHPYSYRAKDFILRFRKPISSSIKLQEIPKLMFTAEGTPYIATTGGRKQSKASVTVFGRGSGKISINGEGVLYFKNIQDREQAPSEVFCWLSFKALIFSPNHCYSLKG
ncbi:28S ribosomal protein S9, mitochondrial-like [Homarus americanus]|uniref:28S ribosomal protein S9, mitochondrial-like n=1 Tax=Homarus americanus TaxID=6706 RepID=UPI001C489088|nr:28S ribosomal protein S9, mitochondrial-like [Homarus americanus]